MPIELIANTSSVHVKLLYAVGMSMASRRPKYRRSAIITTCVTHIFYVMSSNNLYAVGLHKVGYNVSSLITIIM